MLQQMADVRAEIEATRRVTRDRTRQLDELDVATRRMQEVEDMARAMRASGEHESVPAAVQLPAPPPSPIQETAAAPVASPVPTPVSTWQGEGDRQAELDAIRARNSHSSAAERAGVVVRRLEDLPEAQRDEARRVIGRITAMRTFNRVGFAIMNGDDMNAESITMQLSTTPVPPVTSNTPWINLQLDLRHQHVAMPKSNPTSSLSAPETCSICKEAQSCVVFTGCGHVCTCVICANKMQKKTCPICRKQGSTFPIYMA